MIRHLIILLAIIHLSVYSSIAQYKAVSGNVYGFKDLRLKNIKVEAKKSGAAVLTDTLGNFVISCYPKDKLIFTGNGFRRTIKPLNKKDRIIVKMVMLEGVKNQEIAVGYEHVSQYEMNYAMAHYALHNNDFGNYVDIFDLIRGKFAGVQVVGGGDKRIIVRGISSNSNNYAIYVVNGTIYNDISFIEPTNVKSIDVIKDGNALYGSRGANGVVLITTLDNSGGLHFKQ